MENIKLFATKQLRSNYEDSTRYVEPYVSLEEETNELKYNDTSFIRITVWEGRNIILQGGKTLSSGEYTINMKQNFHTSLGITDGKEYIEELDLFDYNRKRIEQYYFEGFTNLHKVYLSNKINTISEGAFNNCTYLESIINTENIEAIGSNTFANCVNLESFTFSDKIKNVATNAFSNCPHLTNITFKSKTPQPYFVTILNSINTIQNIYVPQDAVQTYKTAQGWSAYASKIKPIEQ